MPNSKSNPLPSLNALRAFEAAGRLLSFTLAARELNVTQGAVSRQIKQLETDLNISLFIRQHRKLVLTDQGALLLPPLTRAFGIMNDALDALKHQQKDLNLKVHPTFAIRWLIPRLHRFQTQYPDIRVRLTTSSANVDFSRENFDAGITHLGGERAGVKRCKILEERLVPVCSPRLLQEDIPLDNPGDLSRHMLLHNNPNLREWQAWANQMDVEGLRLERGQVFEVDDAALQAAVAGLGVALGDQFLIREELTSGRLVAPFGHIPFKTGFYYFSRPDFNEHAPEVKAFQEWLVHEMEASRTLDEPHTLH
ncbi:MAG: transcriptional regulator GcvA [Desulfobacterales bacterium]|nr:transcriptional regulator GcvA [Desulfobacterales bacterium]